MAQTLYDKYGGLETVQKIVHEFYRRVLESEALSPFFAKIEMEHLMKHQADFLSQVLGGPMQYQGRDLKAAHKDLKIKDEHFGEVAGILQDVLEEFEVEPQDIETILGVVGGTKPDIVVDEAA